MSTTYNPTAIEERWQAWWEEKGLFQQSENQAGSPEDKMYLLFAFAYPSGSGLHVGHVESKTALDIMARYYRMNGKQVFFPVGWDAFGLPAENYAIKTGIHPAETTKSAINTFRRQIKRIGVSYDWANELATSHPDYYQWTQWLFIQMYNKGLAYRGKGMVNWCPSCQTVLANEQVVDGTCERCGTAVVQKDLEQWYFKITQYKDELISGLNEVDWPEATKQHQLHWIGKAQGLNITFQLQEKAIDLTIWTKFWETVFGTTFVVIAPEKFESLGLTGLVPSDRQQAVSDYLEAAKHKTEEERKIGQKDKTGVDTGLHAVNPVNGEAVPLFIADYVLMGVGTAIVMGVPAHDERDFAFAKKFDLPVRQVVSYSDKEIDKKVAASEISFEGEGVLVNSGQFDGQDAWGKGKKNMADWMIKQGWGEWQTTYKLRDWLISRQRYWGAPIPIVYDPEGQPHPVKEEHLPWTLPTDVEFKPTGESPLTHSKEFIERTEKLYGKGWRPEFDTMDTFVDSSWYFLRYVSARNEKTFMDKDQAKKWLPVDLYMIGPEHIVLHLLYSRFFTKFLRDEGYLSFNEPFMKMRHQGMIMGPDGKKMSKSKGNVINPDEVIEKFGADTLRVYEMFMGPLEADKPWSVTAVAGVYRFLSRVHKQVSEAIAQPLSTSAEGETATRARRKLHQTIRKVTQDIPALKFNTAIASMMEFMNVWEEANKSAGQGALSSDEIKMVIQMLAPFAPFMAEELWQTVNSTSDQPQVSVHTGSWPTWDEALAQEEQVIIPVQVNGKVREQLSVTPTEAQDQAAILAKAKAEAKVQQWLSQGTLKKEIYVPGKIVNLVVG
ncbi:MAG TPA: leucine--tRNA ligase [Vitreimonas sp.]|nr:leucine--tRNA ligase [Vitreimonas sp.]